MQLHVDISLSLEYSIEAKSRAPASSRFMHIQPFQIFLPSSPFWKYVYFFSLPMIDDERAFFGCEMYSILRAAKLYMSANQGVMC